MKYRTLGRTGLKVSVIGIGTWQFGGEWGKDFSQDEVNRMLARAKDLGCNLIDTAECYGDHLSEALIGNYLASSGTRNHWIIATKFGHKFHGHMNRTEPRSPRDVEKQLEESLQALQTDRIDLYQYHSWGDAQFEDAGVREVLAKAKVAGKIRHIGNSVGPNDKPHQVALSEQYDVGAIQVVYNRLSQQPEKEVLPICQQKNLGVLARVPLASGYLSGKYKPGAKFADPRDVRAGHKQEQIDERLATVQEIERNELPAGVPMAQWALAWCLKHPAVTCVIPGCKNIEQVESNAGAADLDLVK